MSKLITIAEFIAEKERIRTMQLMQKKAQLDQKLKSNAEYQRRARMTPNERARDAMQRMAQNIKIFRDTMGYDHGVTSYDQALQKAKEIAMKADRDNNEG